MYRCSKAFNERAYHHLDAQVQRTANHQQLLLPSLSGRRWDQTGDQTSKQSVALPLLGTASRTGYLAAAPAV
jgi:hypothetical protein